MIALPSVLQVSTPFVVALRTRCVLLLAFLPRLRLVFEPFIKKNRKKKGFGDSERYSARSNTSDFRCAILIPHFVCYFSWFSPSSSSKRHLFGRKKNSSIFSSIFFSFFFWWLNFVPYFSTIVGLVFLLYRVKTVFFSRRSMILPSFT